MTTIVSGFIDISKYNTSPKTLDFFIDRAKYFLELPYNKVIFLEKDVITLLKSYENEYTTFIPFEKEEMFLWEQRESILQKQLPSRRNKIKDTHDYMMVQIQKTHWIKKAIELNIYNTDQFIWIDMGIYWIVNDPELFKEGCKHLMSEYPTIRIPGCWNIYLQPFYITYEQIMWCFCGGVFGGHKDSLLKFHSLVEEKVNEVLENGYIIWEVNIWYMIFTEHPYLFDWYYADHNISMIQNYS
jgi:hypothetical protein